jgi:type IV pilus assembly protein PilP
MRGAIPTLALATLLGAVACGEKKPPPRPAAPPAPTAAGAGAADKGADKAAAPEWSYSSVGKRDPFRSFLAEIEGQSRQIRTRCPTPLGRYELEQLQLAAVITGLEDPVAMVQAPTGTGYAVRRGACIGKNGGTVVAVRSGEVVVSEWAIRADGPRDRTQTVLKLPKQASLNVEE